MRRHGERDRMKTRFPYGLDNAPHSRFSVFFRVWTDTPLVSRPHLSAFRQLSQHANFFYKNGKHQRSASALPSVTEWLDSVLLAAFFFFKQWDSSTLQAVWWESRLLCGSSASRTQRCQERRDGGILHTIALLFGCHLCTICIWPHSNSGWIRRLWRCHLHGLQYSYLFFLCVYLLDLKKYLPPYHFLMSK